MYYSKPICTLYGSLPMIAQCRLLQLTACRTITLRKRSVTYLSANFRNKYLLKPLPNVHAITRKYVKYIYRSDRNISPIHQSHKEAPQLCCFYLVQNNFTWVRRLCSFSFWLKKVFAVKCTHCHFFPSHKADISLLDAWFCLSTTPWLVSSLLDKENSSL